MDGRHHQHKGGPEPNITKSLSVSSHSESESSSSDDSCGGSCCSRNNSPRRGRNERDIPRTIDCPTCHGSGKIPSPPPYWENYQCPPMNYDFYGYSEPAYDYRSYYQPPFPAFPYPYPPSSDGHNQFRRRGHGRRGHHKRHFFGRGGHRGNDAGIGRQAYYKDHNKCDDNKECPAGHHPHDQGYPYPPPPPPPPPFYHPGQATPNFPNYKGHHFFDPKYWDKHGVDFGSLASMFGEFFSDGQRKCGKKCGKRCSSENDNKPSERSPHDEQGPTKSGDQIPPNVNNFEDVD